MTKAVIFLPPDQPIDGTYARQCMIHNERRGYELHSVVSKWNEALTLIRERYAQVIVFARLDHLGLDWEPRVEFVGDETIDLSRVSPVRPRNERYSETGDSRSRRPRPAAF